MENKSQPPVPGYESQKKRSQETGRKIGWRRIIKKLASNQHRPIEYALDELSNYKLFGIQKLVSSIVDIVETGYITLTKEKNGFSFKLKEKEKDKENEKNES